MSAISSWILSISGIICLSVLVELVLPSGQMKPYIKVVFSFVIVLVIISPLESIATGQFDFSSVLTQTDYELQDDYLAYFSSKKVEALQTEAETRICAFGVSGASVSAKFGLKDGEIVVSAIYVDLSNICISDSLSNISISDIKAEIEEIVRSVFSLDDEEVIFSG